MVIEVEEIEGQYAGAVEKGLPISQELKDQSWGHRNFCVRDPNGLTLYFFQELDRAIKSLTRHHVVMQRRFCTLVVLIGSASGPPSLWSRARSIASSTRKRSLAVRQAVAPAAQRPDLLLDPDAGGEAREEEASRAEHAPHLPQHGAE